MICVPATALIARISEHQTRAARVTLVSRTLERYACLQLRILSAPFVLHERAANWYKAEGVGWRKSHRREPRRPPHKGATTGEVRGAGELPISSSIARDQLVAESKALGREGCLPSRPHTVQGSPDRQTRGGICSRGDISPGQFYQSHLVPKPILPVTSGLDHKGPTNLLLLSLI